MEMKYNSEEKVLKRLGIGNMGLISKNQYADLAKIWS
jgi:hypothetical protein